MTQPVDADKLYADVWQLRREDRAADALAMTSTALTVIRQGSDGKSLARVLCVMGQLERDRGQEAAAVACYEEAASLYRGAGDQVGLVYALRHAGDILRELGRLSEAAPCCDEALALCRTLAPTPLDLANMLRVCALLKEDLGETDEARRLWTEAKGHYRTAGVEAGVREAERRGF